MEQEKENIHAVISWAPETIVDLIGELAWPVVILLISWRFKDSIKSGITNFLSQNNVTEVSVGAGGITAKIEASKQAAESVNIKKPTEPLPEGKDAESIRQLQTERATQYSLELQQRVQKHIDAFEITEQAKIELLCSEVSLLQAVLNYVDITTVLFLSQYNLFNKLFYPLNIVTKDEIENYFEELKEINTEGYKDWDVDKYLAYPLSINMIESYENGYRLTKLGSSYVIHLRNNPSFLDYLANL